MSDAANLAQIEDKAKNDLLKLKGEIDRSATVMLGKREPLPEVTDSAVDFTAYRESIGNIFIVSCCQHSSE